MRSLRSRAIELHFITVLKRKCALFILTTCSACIPYGTDPSAGKDNIDHTITAKRYRMSQETQVWLYRLPKDWD